MKCQADIQALAKTKAAEAECLLNRGFFDGAYYLAGYAIELLLKARICKTLGIDDFFVFDRTAKKELYRPFKVHNFEELFLLSGIYSEFMEAKKNESGIMKAWSVIAPWSEEMRYLTGKTPPDVANFVTSVKTIASWIASLL